MSFERKLTIGFSPCPNDTFMFDALVHQRIDTGGLQFEVVMEDVETLNRLALQGRLDVSKVSFALFTFITKDYQLLHAGSALGRGVGPLVISKTKMEMGELRAGSAVVAIPGRHTTANFLFGIFFPEAKQKEEMIFSAIEDAVLSGHADAGVIIHENRFTYEEKGLKKVCDLGELWEEETGQPIPLGGIAIKRDLPEDLKTTVDRLVKKSVEYAFEHPDASAGYVREHAREMNEKVRKQHIETYVNKFSVDPGAEGRAAIETLFRRSSGRGVPSGLFVTDSEIIS